MTKKIILKKDEEGKLHLHFMLKQQVQMCLVEPGYLRVYVKANNHREANMPVTHVRDFCGRQLRWLSGVFVRPTPGALALLLFQAAYTWAVEQLGTWDTEDAAAMQTLPEKLPPVDAFVTAMGAHEWMFYLDRDIYVRGGSSTDVSDEWEQVIPP